MTRTFALLLALLSTLAAAQTVTRGGALKKRAYQTYSAMTLYVDPTGSDSNACTSSGTGACASVNGALLKLPAKLRHVITVNVAAGTYATPAQNWPQFTFADAGQLVIQGTMSNWTPATGSAAGTVTAYTPQVHTTVTPYIITDSGQSWTTDDLKGSYLLFTSGSLSGTSRVIIANTATTVTITGGYVSSVGMSYAIQRPNAILSGNTGILLVWAGLSGGTPASSAVILSDLGITNASAVGTTMRLLSFNVGTALGVRGQDITLRRLRVISGSTALDVSNSAVAFSANTTYFEGASSAAVVRFYDSSLRENASFIRNISTGNAVSMDGASNMIVGGQTSAWWGTYEAGSAGYALYMINTTVTPGRPSGRGFDVSMSGGLGCISMQSGTNLYLTYLKCSTPAVDVTLEGGAFMRLSDYAGWSASGTNALSIDGTLYSSSFIEALVAPKSISNSFGTVLMRQ